MSVNSPVVPVVTARNSRPGAALGVETTSRRQGPGAHREPGVTAWRTSMRELVYFLTLGYVQPWRRAQTRTV